MGKIIYTYVVGDIIHVGHLTYLENAKNLGGLEDKLIVGVLTDEATMEKKPKPTLQFSERMRLVKALRCVDCVVAQHTYSPLENVKSIHPDILVESSSHEERPADKYIKDYGGRVVVLPYSPEQSSSNIKDKVREE